MNPDTEMWAVCAKNSVGRSQASVSPGLYYIEVSHMKHHVLCVYQATAFDFLQIVLEHGRLDPPFWVDTYISMRLLGVCL